MPRPRGGGDAFGCFDPVLDAGGAALNRLLFAWIEGEYHQRPHRGLGGEPPLDRWLRVSDGIRSLPANVDLDGLFRDEQTRRVARDGTFTLRNRRLEAGPRFIGRRVTVRFDPFETVTEAIDEVDP